MPRRVVALAAVNAVLFAAGVAVAVVDRGNQPLPRSLRSVVERIEAFDARARALPFVDEVSVRLAGSSRFRRLLRDQAGADVKELANTSVTLTTLGLLPPGTDLAAALETLLDSSVIGYYDPDHARLVVRGAHPTPLARTTLAHELTHALQDQHFHLSRFDKLTDEAAAAATALIEGDAVRIERAYTQTLTPADLLGAQLEAARLGRPTGVPPVLESLLVFPYVAGPAFVDAIVARGGNAGVDRAFRTPPVSTEQILHPQAYFDDERPAEVRAPAIPAGATRVDHGQFGEFGLRLVLGDSVDESTAVAAAQGWGGDQYVTWRVGSREVVAARIEMDTERDAIELETALARFTARRAAVQANARVTRDRATLELQVERSA